MEQWTGSKLGKECVKVVYCHHYLTSIQSTSCEMQGWVKHKLESRLPGEISITPDTHMTPPLWQKAKRNQRSNCQHQSDHRISKRIPGGGKKNSTSASLTMLTLLTVRITINWKILKEIGNLSPEKAACWSRNNN